MKPMTSLAIAGLALLAACEGRTEENIAAAAEKQAEGMAAQAGNEIEAAGEAIAKGASEVESEVDPGGEGAGNQAEPANRQ